MESTQTATTDIAGLKAELHYARINAVAISDTLADKRSELSRQIEELTTRFHADNAELIDVESAAVATRDSVEALLRNALIEHFEATGEKTFDKDCGVMVTTKYDYTDADAVAWSKANAPVLVKEVVDTKAFEKMPMVEDLEFVTVEKRVSAKLAKEFTL